MLKLSVLFCFAVAGLLSLESTHAADMIDIGIRCGPRMSSSQKLMVGGGSSLEQRRVCLDKSSYLSGVEIGLVELRTSSRYDIYGLVLHVAQSASDTLDTFSKGHTHDQIVIIKDGRAVIEGELEAGFEHGVIFVSVSDESAGREVLDIVKPLRRKQK